VRVFSILHLFADAKPSGVSLVDLPEVDLPRFAGWARSTIN
jgi:hypothetical protein